MRLAPPSHKQKGDFPLPLGNWGRLHAQHWRPLLTCFLKVSQCSTMIFLTEQYEYDTKQKRYDPFHDCRGLFGHSDHHSEIFRPLVGIN